MHPRPRTRAVEHKDRLVRHLEELLQNRSEILFALLHGSFLAGGPFRDVDLALYVDPESIGSATFREYESDLAVRLGEAVGLPVDVCVLNDAPLAFRYHALKGHVLLVRAADLLDEFRARTWDDYCTSSTMKCNTLAWETPAHGGAEHGQRVPSSVGGGA